MNKIYKCSVCGNIVELIHEGGGELVCCGQPMDLIKQKEKDEGVEKHLPVVTEADSGVMVKVGEVEHPMEEEHFIEWIEVITDGSISRKFLSPGDSPEADFAIASEKVEAREYCNVHGLWKS